MSDSKSDIEPEPVDAEFEPAPPENAAPTRSKSGLSLGMALGVFVLASLAGGAIGFGGARTFPAPAEIDLSGADAERAALTEHIGTLEDRLAALENAPAPTAESSRNTRSLQDLTARLDTLESDIEAGNLATPASSASAEAVADLTSLLARLDALEAAAALPREAFDASSLEQRLSALESGQTDLGNQLLAALQQGPSAAAPDLEAINDLAGRIAALETAAAQTAQTASSAPSDALMATLTARIETLESALQDTRDLAETARSASQTAQSSADRAQEIAGDAAQSAAADTSEDDRRLAARALALTALRDRAATGEAFEAERAALARLWRENPHIEALSANARAGVLSIDELAETYPGDEIRNAGATVNRLWGMIELQRVDPDSDESGTLALTALSEERLGEGDLETAITITERLEGDALDAARDWLVLARARLAVDTNIEALRADLTRLAAELGADPS